MISLSKRVSLSNLTFVHSIVLFTIILGPVGPWFLQPAWACPMCSENLSTDTPSKGQDTGDANPTPTKNGSNLAAGFYYSILLMLAVPFSMMAGLGGALYHQMRKAAATAEPPTSPHPRSID